jgi:hypothetical protein
MMIIIITPLLTIRKYEEAIAEQSRRIFKSNEILKPFLDKIQDLDNQLALLQYQEERKTEEDEDKGAAAT